jgi:hypothetical protein
MFIRALEYFLINILNGAKRKRAASPVSRPTATVTPPPDYTILGHLLPDLQQPAIDPITVQLHDAGVVALSPEARMRHLYLLGATGTGKTNLLLRLIESDIANRRAFCVIDLRGDLVDRILPRLVAAAPPEEWQQRLLLLDLRDSQHSVGFNPLAGEGDAYTHAMLMLSVLKKESDSWGVQLEETLRNCLLALAETRWSLLEIAPLLTNAAFRSQVLAGVKDPQVKSFFERFEQLSAAERNKWAGAVLNKITPLLSIPALRLMFGQREGFSFSHLLDEQPGMIILISLAVDRLHDAARLTGGLLVSNFQSAIMSRVEQPEAQRVPAHLYVDEFECMASDKFEEIVAEGRRFRVGLTLSHQNLSQLPTNLRQVIRNNVHTQVYFQTGAGDAAELAKEVGGGKGSDAVRATLMSQGTGEAFLVRRGQPSSRMKTLRSTDPAVKAERVQELRAVAFASYARRRSEVEEELQAREAQFRALVSPASGVAGGSSSRTSGNSPVYEIRHDKLSHFGPPTPEPAGSSDDTTSSDHQAPDSQATEDPVPDNAPTGQDSVTPVQSATPGRSEATTPAQAPPLSRPVLKPKDAGAKRGRKTAATESTKAKESTKKKGGKPQDD